MLSGVVALLPDHPPRRFSWRGKTYQVAAGDGPERFHGEWWLRTGEMWAVRDYFQVETTSGERFWLFRRGDGVESITGDLRWYIHGVFGRSEARRVGKECVSTCRSRGWRDHLK